MLRILIALFVLASASSAQHLTRSAPLGRPSPAHVFHPSTDGAARFFRGPPPPSSSSCRDLLAQTNWTGQHGMNPYTGTEPLTSITFDHCAIFQADKDYENTSTLSEEFVEVMGQAVHFHSEIGGFAIGDFDVTVFDLDLGRLAFDGTIDFQGPSGAHLVAEPGQMNALLFSITFPVLDEEFFRSSWTIDTAAVLSELCNFIGHGNYVYDPHNLAAMAVVAKYNGAASAPINDDWHDVAREAALIDESQAAYELENRTPVNWPGAFADTPQVWRVEKSPLGDRTRRVTFVFAGSAIRVLGFQPVDLGIENRGSFPLDNVIARWKGSIEFRTCAVSRRLPGASFYTQPYEYLYSTPHLDPWDGTFDCDGASGKKWALNTLWYEGRTLLPDFVQVTDPMVIAALCRDAPGDPGFAHFQVTANVADEWSATGPQGQVLTQDSYGHFRM